MSPILLLIALLMAHFYFDYAGQGDFMAGAKNVTKAIPGVPYWQPLLGHCFIHGGAVALIVGLSVDPALWWFFVPEAVIHGITDDAKCRGHISYNTDQAVHVACKLAWWGIALGLA